MGWAAVITINRRSCIDVTGDGVGRGLEDLHVTKEQFVEGDCAERHYMTGSDLTQ